MNLGTKLAAVAIAAVSVAACGGSGNSDEEQVSKVVVDVNKELVTCLGDAECDPAIFDQYATGSALDELNGVVAGMASATINAQMDVNVGKVEIDGDAATAEACSLITINGASQNGEAVDSTQLGNPQSWVKQSYELVKVDGTWKVSANEELDSGDVTDGVDPCAS